MPFLLQLVIGDEDYSFSRYFSSLVMPSSLVSLMNFSFTFQSLIHSVLTFEHIRELVYCAWLETIWMCIMHVGCQKLTNEMGTDQMYTDFWGFAGFAPNWKRMNDCWWWIMASSRRDLL
jgi:hypothetical protein